MSEHIAELELEQRHLARVIAIAREQLADARARTERGGRAISEASRAMREEDRRSDESLWVSDGFEEIAAISQLVERRAADLVTREMLLRRVRVLTGMLEKPYFARIDLTFDDGGDREAVYVGRGTLKDESTHELHVHDWRAPVASVFYRFGTGRFSYDAPGGAITGEMTRKRQYEIRGGALEYFFDADVRVEDEFLRAMLARNASPRMKAIVETIQRDQDAAIRDEASDLLMVQGAAGSGKTSVALHRAAYLMYQDLKNPLAAGEILILSPNALFERYIGNVLPELTEASAETAPFEGLLSKLLGGARVETRSERFEALCLAGEGERARRGERMAFLSSPAFRTILERYARELPARGIGYQDIVYAGRTLFTREELRARVLKDSAHLPLAARLRRLESAVWDAVRLQRPGHMKALLYFARANPRHALEVEECARAYSMLESEALARQMRAFTRPNPRALYEALLSDERRVRRLGRGLELPEDFFAILQGACGSGGGGMAASAAEMRAQGASEPFGGRTSAYESDSGGIAASTAGIRTQGSSELFGGGTLACRSESGEMTASAAEMRAQGASEPFGGRTSAYESDSGGMAASTAGIRTQGSSVLFGGGTLACRSESGEMTASAAEMRAQGASEPFGGEIPLEDAAAIAYLALLLGCADASPGIRQVVVDEAQDYDPLGYALLGRLFPRARFTVLGDIRQALDRKVDMDLYDAVEAALARKKTARVTLDKSFRCTREILEFALKFLPAAAGIVSFNRSGEPPKEYAARDAEELAGQVKAEIEACRAAGMSSVALIAKTARDARAWADRLGVPLLDPDAGEAMGAFVMPLALSKGLEFDAVLVLDAGGWGEGRLLYVACTRALHRLSLFSVGKGEDA